MKQNNSQKNSEGGETQTSPTMVTTGTPAQRASVVVVCALYCGDVDGDGDDVGDSDDVGDCDADSDDVGDSGGCVVLW